MYYTIYMYQTFFICAVHNEVIKINKLQLKIILPSSASIAGWEKAGIAGYGVRWIAA